MSGKAWRRLICICLIILYAVYMYGSSYIVINYYGRIYQIDWQRDFINLSVIWASINLFYTWKEPEYRRWIIPVSIIISTVLAITSYILFFVYLPKYTVKEAYDIIKEDPKYNSSDVSRVR